MASHRKPTLPNMSHLNLGTTALVSESDSDGSAESDYEFACGCANVCTCHTKGATVIPYYDADPTPENDDPEYATPTDGYEIMRAPTEAGKASATAAAAAAFVDQPPPIPARNQKPRTMSGGAGAGAAATVEDDDDDDVDDNYDYTFSCGCVAICTCHTPAGMSKGNVALTAQRHQHRQGRTAVPASGWNASNAGNDADDGLGHYSRAFEEQHRRLVEMGFTDDARNTQVLSKYDGRIDAALQELVTGAL